MLTEIDLSRTMLSEESIIYMVNNITPNIKKLGLNHLDSVTDMHVKTLVSRCTNLTALDLSETSISKNSLTSIIQHLKPRYVGI